MMTTVKKMKNTAFILFVCWVFSIDFFLLFDPNIFIKFHFAEELAPENHHICLNLFRSFLFSFFGCWKIENKNTMSRKSKTDTPNQK